MRPSLFLCSILIGILFPALLFAQTPFAGKNVLFLRGQQEYLYLYPAQGEPKSSIPKILFAPGDGGWRGYAIELARVMALWGYDVYGLDTKHYLQSFTGKTTLKETDVMSDFRQIAEWMIQGAGGQVTLVGWSEGAGLCLLAAASEENKKIFKGLITIGLAETSALGWRWLDNLTYLTKKDPKEPLFWSVDFLPRVTPLPLLMIHATQDDWVSPETARRMFDTGQEPKRFILVKARNHRFDGNREEFFRLLREGLQWINSTRP